MEYDWPGNIRELKSVLEYAFVIAESGQIEVGHLPAPFQKNSPTRPHTSPIHYGKQAVAKSGEKEALIQTLHAAEGNKSSAAQILGVNRMTVWNRMQKHGLHLEKKVTEGK